jgi:hypothetical protein
MRVDCTLRPRMLCILNRISVQSLSIVPVGTLSRIAHVSDLVFTVPQPAGCFTYFRRGSAPSFPRVGGRDSFRSFPLREMSPMNRLAHTWFVDFLCLD